MDRDFHYYGTVLAAYRAGFSVDEARLIGTSAQFIDDCTETLTHSGRIFLGNCRARQFNVKMGNGTVYPFFPVITSVYGVADWVPTSNADENRQIWMPFHFLPGNFPGQRSKFVELRGTVDAQGELVEDSAQSIQLLCRPRSDSAQHMINFARQAYAHIKPIDPELALMLIGCVMHVFADTYAHQDFAGTASYALNGVENDVSDNPGRFTLYGRWDGAKWQPNKATFRKIVWPREVVFSPDWLNRYPPGAKISDKSSVGHGQVGHMPDCSTIAYWYKPVWSPEPILRNNPQQYMDAFIDMITALGCIKSNSAFIWDDTQLTQREFELKRLQGDQVLSTVQQLFCPDVKSAPETKMYEEGLCILASDWFLKSEERWSKALADMLGRFGYNPDPGYNEAKFGWPRKVEKLKTDPVPVDTFTSLKFFKWSVAAKLLFRANYGQLRGLGNGIGRIVRAAQFSSTMDPRQSVMDEFSRYWQPNDSASVALNNALVTTGSSDEMNSVLLGPYSHAPSDTATTQWFLLQQGGRYLSFSATSRLSSGAVRQAFTPTVSNEVTRAQPMILPNLTSNDTVYLRTVENRVGHELFLEYPESQYSKILWFNQYGASVNQQWKRHIDLEANQSSFESVRYPGWFLGVDGDEVKAVNKEVFWVLTPYQLNPVMSVPAPAV